MKKKTPKMNKTTIIAAVLAIAGIIGGIANAATQYVGQIVQKVDASGYTVPISGTVTSNISGSTVAVVNQAGQDLDVNVTNASIAVTGNVGITGTVTVDGSGVTQPISAAALPLPSGAATSALQTTGNSSLSSIDGKTPSLGQAAMSASVPVAIASDQSAIAVDGSAVTQPISAASLPLPSGAATSANQSTGNASLSSIDGKLPASVGSKTSAASLSVVLASDHGNVTVTYPVISAPVISTAAVAGVSKQLIAANASRKGIECESRCTNTDRVFISFGASPATTESKPIEACSSWQPPYGVSMTAEIRVIANSGTQDVVCVEY